MTVGFDITWMDKDNKAGGVYQYAFRLITALVQYAGIRVVAIIGRNGKGIFESLKMNNNFREVLLEDPSTLADLVQSEGLDIIHTPVQYFPSTTLSVPMVMTLHDLQHFHYPEFFTADQITFRDTFYKSSAEFATRVIVSYQHVKDDVVEHYGIPPEKIDVCSLGSVFPQTVDVNRFQALKQKFGIPDTYLFYSANAWPHKNHIGLIRALKILHDKYNQKISLVCTGQKNTDYYPRIEKEINKYNLKHFVFFTDYVAEMDVNALLTNASLVVIPTLYEAGSFPLMEAMANDVPVICSDVTSLPETIGDRRFVFDPTDIEQIAEKASMMLKNKKLVEENKLNSRIQIKDNNWERAVHNFLNTYKIAMELSKNRLFFTSKVRVQIYESFYNNQLRRQHEQLKQQEKIIEGFLNSYSWKLTSPMRAVAAFFKKRFPGID